MNDVGWGGNRPCVAASFRFGETGSGARELGVVIQDLSLETLERGARIDPELVDESRAGLLERL
jgi:hypothetical protein